MLSNQSDGSRLMITRMVLENFKSYAGIQEIGPFHKRFSSIVGPNGSGKSNVIDALLFVFGKRAKQLRLNKVSELIHKSAAFPDLDYARVEIHFQRILDDESSTDDFQIVAGSQFVVARIAYSNNQSKYTVDGRNSSYTDVGLLLRQHAVDLDNNRFLILQGEVEQIAMMKPKALTPHDEGLLEYLEDIIGSNRFVADIEAASKKVEELNETRGEQVKSLKRAEKQRETWRGPRDEAESYLSKEREVRCKQNLLYQRQSYEKRTSMEAASLKLERYKEKVTVERQKLFEREAAASDLEKKYQSIHAEHDRLALAFARKSEEYTQCQGRLEQLSQDQDHAQKQIKKQQGTIASEKQKEETALAEAEAAEAKVVSGTQSIDALEARKREQEALVEAEENGFRAASAALRARLEDRQRELAEANRAVADIATKRDQQETALQLVRKRSVAESQALQQARESLRVVEGEAATLDARLLTCEEQRARAMSQQADLELETKTLSEKETGLQTRLCKAAEAAEEGRAALQRGRGRSAVLSALLQASRKGGVLAGAGVRGRLGDLGSVDPKYDAAVSAATGMLDSVVVETVAGAEACMEFLRNNNVGRANFVALEKLDTRRMSGPHQEVQGAPRLFDLVRTEPALRPAFYRALGDTLVVDNLTVATQIAYKGDRAVHRVVTLDGNLIETSGTMTGGGSAGKAVGAGMRAGAGTDSEVTQEDCQALEQSEALLKTELEQTRALRRTAEDKLSGLHRTLQNLSSELEEIKCAQQRKAQVVHELSRTIASLSKSAGLSREEQKQVEELEAAISATVAEISANAPELANLQQQVKSLQQEIRSVGGPKMKRLRAELDSIGTDLDDAQKRLAEAEVLGRESRKQANKAANASSKAQKELEKTEARLTSIEADREMLQTQIDQLLEANNEAKALATAKESELSSTRDEFQKLTTETEVVRGTVDDLNKSISEADKTIKTLKKELQQLTGLLAKVRSLHEREARDYGGGEYVDVHVESPPDAAQADAQCVPMDVPAAGSSHSEAEGGEEVEPADGSMDVSERAGSQVPEDADDDDDDDDCGERSRWLSLYSYSDRRLARECRKTVDDLLRSINLAETQRDQLKGTVDMRALIEFRDCDKVVKEQEALLAGITAERDQHRAVHEDLRRRRLEEFMAGFGTITLKLKEMYQMITLGGDAELELVDSLDPFAEGVVFSVRPPKKSWKNISNLSGGEKTLSSLALVFALHHYKPTPLYVMDEIDAALDFKNVSIVANYIKERTKNAQFIIISLRNNMFELADRLVGIYKTHDATKSVTIDPRMFSEAVAGTADGSKTGAGSASGVGRGSDGPLETPARPVLGDATNTYLPVR